MRNNVDYETSKSIWFRDLPSTWKVKRFKYLTQSRKEVSTTGEEELLSVTEVRGIVKRRELKSNDDSLSRAEDLTGYRHVKKGDLVSNIMLVWKRGLGVSPYNGIVSPAYSVFTFSDECYPDYYNYLVRSDEYITEFRRHSTGITMSRLRLYDDSFGTVFAHVPPFEEQKLISRYLDNKTKKIDFLVEKIQKKIELLKEQRTTLIYQCVTKGLDPNVEMKDSGVELIGKIPKHWTLKKLPWICFFQEGPGLRNWQFTDYGTPVVCVTNIKPTGLTFEKYQRYISKNEYSSSYKHFTVEDGDLLMASSGNSFGKVCRYNGEFNEKFILNTSTIRLHSYDESVLSTNFLKSFIESEVFQIQIRILITGAAQPNFGPSHLNQIYCPLPPIKEQKLIMKKIDSVIVNLDKVLEKEKFRITLLKEYRESLISSIVTGKIRVNEDMI